MLSVCTVSSAPSATWSIARVFRFANLSSRGLVILLINIAGQSVIGASGLSDDDDGKNDRLKRKVVESVR
jgi:hypothetical protein